ncbi:hypothetical protein DVA67_013650 [Solirubrobacter sp. CPCC 204708]|uniref:Uncharacterized protein n=1 Tax=Solirubrobacter deserti TaxID=2282478 RepID=A0ABT4RC32_9ACTN|nr:hypothetical protein [Solirubrobacter deserti]MBE2317021.1 hypothetical protein [Solirubrobacter deserti]MDA0136087.1 hypothetical protein [Solirubrobacter deserti]
MSGGFPHVHLGPNAEAEPGSVPRSYRLTVLLERVTEWEAVAIAREVADVLAAAGIAIRGEDETVRSVIGVQPHPWPVGPATAEELIGAEHILVPKSVPQTPDLSQDYSPN